jgi:serralysin
VVQSSVTFTLGSNVENLTLTGANPINGTGNTSANILIGNSAVNILDGLGGDDQIHGGGGNDTIVTGTGSDGIYFDTALNAATNVDAITDFDVALDTIFLDDAIFAGLAVGPLAAGAFQSGAVALDADDRILYDSATGQIRFDADGTGAGAAILFATVTAGTALTNADFTIY